MPTTEDGKKTGAAARAEQADDNSFVSRDTFTNPAIATLVNTATVEDAQGIERIVSPSTDSFAPAPLEASDEEKEAAEKRNKLFEDSRKDRLSQLRGEDKDEDRLVNAPGVGGSDGGTVTEKQAEETKAAGKQDAKTEKK